MKYVRIGELAKMSGVSPRTIDYYTQLGLIVEARRSAGKHRLYAPESLNTIRLIQELKKHHFTLAEIKHLLVNGRDSDFLEKMVRLRQKLDDLEVEFAGLYPAIQKNKLALEHREGFEELINKGIQVIQVLLILLGEPMV